MFANNQIPEAFASVHTPNGKKAIQKNCQKLPLSIRSIALGLLNGPEWHWNQENNAAWTEYCNNVDKFARLPKTKQQKVFDAFFPHFGKEALQAWYIHLRLPYQQGYSRKGFRLPKNPNAYIKTQANWLGSLLSLTQNFYDQDLIWFTVQASRLPGYGTPQTLSLLFAAAINDEDDAVTEVLHQSATGEHPVATMGRHVIKAFLIADYEPGWELVENLLRAAQRQEGLRQVIFETIDLAHPRAFRRMLQIILDENLVRFASVVRAVDVWFGMNWDVTHKKEIVGTLTQLAVFMDGLEERAKALEGSDPQSMLLALWSIAFKDAAEAANHAAKLLHHPDREIRFVGIHMLRLLGLEYKDQILFQALNDSDLLIGAYAFQLVRYGENDKWRKTDLYKHLEKLLNSFPSKTRTLYPKTWDWMKFKISKDEILRHMLDLLGSRNPLDLKSYLEYMDSSTRSHYVSVLLEEPTLTPKMMALLLQFAGDRSQWVRKSVFEKLEEMYSGKSLPEYTAQTIESYLNRKAPDLRRACLSILSKQPNKYVFSSAERLLSGKINQRSGGLALLEILQKEARSSKRLQETARNFIETRKKLTQDEQNILDRILADNDTSLTPENGFGFYTPENRTVPTSPLKRAGVTPASKRAKEVNQFARNIDDFVHENRRLEIITKNYKDEEVKHLLGDMTWEFPGPNPHLPASDQAYPFISPLEAFWRTQDLDRSLLLDAIALTGHFGRMHYRDSDPRWLKSFEKKILGEKIEKKLKYPRITTGMIEWLLWLFPPAAAPQYILNHLAHTYASLPKSAFVDIENRYGGMTCWWHFRATNAWLEIARRHQRLFPQAWEKPDFLELWNLLRWRDEPGYNCSRALPLLEEVAIAHAHGIATDEDVYDFLLAVPTQRSFHAQSMRTLSSPGAKRLFEQFPLLKPLYQSAKDLIVETEMQRGDMQTPFSWHASSLQESGGIRYLVPLLKNLGSANFVRGYSQDSLGKSASLSHLIQVSKPEENDTTEAFSATVKEAGIPENRLVELAVYAPQWASYVEHAISWQGIAEASWWLHAHTRDRSWHIPQEIKEQWAIEVQKRTDLAAEELLDGAVDIRWFQRVYTLLGPERWEVVHAAVRFTSSGTGHTRARLFADAILGNLEEEALTKRVLTKRYQDGVRALGLLPFPEQEAAQITIENRYHVFQEFIRTGKKFGSQRKTSEKLAVHIGLKNLARTAGYPDEKRLEWAVEAKALEKLSSGAYTIYPADLEVSLVINYLGEAELTILKGERFLKSIPARVKKDPDVLELLELKKQASQQVSRMRASLEEAMIHGETFPVQDLKGLLLHPVLKPMLSQILFSLENTFGFLGGGGERLETLDGDIHLNDGDLLTIAHPYDLLASGDWRTWQQVCFRQERIQPFKQVFRELYVLTEAEKIEGVKSVRYAGQQINSNQGAAILGARGWVVSRDNGCFKAFHEENILVSLGDLGFTFSPADVEGVTVEGVYFFKRGELRPMRLDDVPSRVFSEAMRDLDLLVSVAHMGEVDPEASLSTKELRANLVEETCELLGLDNVEIQEPFVIISGKHSDYSLHLGSAIVHQQPGGALCIVPVHAQHRGRLFLPFVDSDPKTAEVMSKVLLLAQDEKIQDPTILEQILR